MPNLLLLEEKEYFLSKFNLTYNIIANDKEDTGDFKWEGKKDT